MKHFTWKVRHGLQELAKQQTAPPADRVTADCVGAARDWIEDVTAQWKDGESRSPLGRAVWDRKKRGRRGAKSAKGEP